MESNSVNVKDLPKIEQIVNGNYLIVEDEQGSKILDFKDFVVGPTNTSFYNAIVTNLTNLSTYSTSLSATIRNNTAQTLAAVDNRFNVLTASFEARYGDFASRFPEFYYYNGTVTISPGASTNKVDFTSNINTLEVEDINITCVTYDISGKNGLNVMPVACGLSFTTAEVTDFISTQELATTPVLYNYTLTVSALKPLVADSPAFEYRFRVLKPYFIT